MKTKNLMPVAHLDLLKAFLESNNWTLQDTVAENEVLRARNKGKGIFILLKTSNPDYYSINEHHGKDVKNYIKLLHNDL